VSFVTARENGASKHELFRVSGSRWLAGLPPLRRPSARSPSSTEVTGAPWLPVVLTWAGEVSVHAGGRGQADPPLPVRPLERLGSGGGGARHRDGNEQPASRRTHNTPLRPQFRAAAPSARPQGVGSRSGCHLAAVDRAAGSCGGEAGSASRRQRQPEASCLDTPTQA